MSPEEIEQGPITGASDIFSLGVVLYELASGTNPFRGESADATTRMILGLAPPPLPDEGQGRFQRNSIASCARCSISRPSTGPARRKSQLQLEALAVPRVQKRVVLAAGAFAALVFCLVGGGIAARRGTPSEYQIYPLASLIGAERQPSFSADGTRVVFAFAGGKDAINHIYVKSVSSAGSTRLTTGTLPDFQPAFSPDGTRLAFLRRTEGRLKVMVMPSGGGIAYQRGEIVDLLREYALMTWDPDRPEPVRGRPR